MESSKVVRNIPQIPVVDAHYDLGIPKLSSRNRKREILQGEIKSPINPKEECRFAGRCKYATEQCHQGVPELREITPGHFVSCFYADK